MTSLPFLRFEHPAALMLLLIATAGAAFLAPSQASAQSDAPAITATPTDQPHVWTITGSGFEPNLQLRVMEIPCSQRPAFLCGGSGSSIFSPVTTSESGTFEVDLDFAGHTPPEGAETFVVAAFPGSRALEATDPTVEIPASAGTGPTPTPTATPEPPVTGTGSFSDNPTTTPLAVAAIAALIATTAAGALALRKH